jgi:hypothetical protein
MLVEYPLELLDLCFKGRNPQAKIDVGKLGIEFAKKIVLV